MGPPNVTAPHHREGEGRRGRRVEQLGSGSDRSSGSNQLENQHSRSYSDVEIARVRVVNLATVAATRGLKLKRQGRELVGPCPRCGEGRDRFAIHVGKQLFHCRGCGGRGGGAIDLVMFTDGIEFADAVERLIGTHSAAPQKATPRASRLHPADDAERRAKRLQSGRKPWSRKARRSSSTFAGVSATTSIRFRRLCFGITQNVLSVVTPSQRWSRSSVTS